MMKNSSLLKWTNIKNAKNNKNANKNWLHPPEALNGGHIVYLVKFLGTTEVSQPKGIEVVKEAMRKLRFNQQVLKSEGTKTPKVELTISVDGVAIQQPKTKKILHQYPLHQISYCADDKAEKKFFSFIAKEGERDCHSCYVFISDKLAEEITLTIGQAFDLAYRRFLETSSREIELRRQVSELQQQLVSSQNENSSLKQRLSQITDLKDKHEIDSFMHDNQITDIAFVHENQSPVSRRTETPTLLPPVPPRNSIKTENLMIDHLSPVPDHPSDDDFDPRAEESPQHLADVANDDDFDPRADEPRPPQSQENILGQNDLLSQFNQMKIGFSRGLSFGTADSSDDFNLDSLDPLKN